MPRHLIKSAIQNECKDAKEAFEIKIAVITFYKHRKGETSNFIKDSRPRLKEIQPVSCLRFPHRLIKHKNIQAVEYLC